MQSAEGDKNIKSSGDDENINFRPSPNFKHMKKYLKSKFDEENSMSNHGSTDSQSPSTSIKQSESETEKEQASEVQPPLPPNSPPPDSPPVIKKEKEEHEEYSSSEAQDQGTEGITPYNSEQAESSEATADTGEIMCRNFIRGTCNRGAACIYVHKLIVSQLRNVYQFCKNFQNRTGCIRPHCKFVHATVFEQEYFYKTGILPPHTTAHLKQENHMPLQQAPTEEIKTEVPTVFLNQPQPQIQLAAMDHAKTLQPVGARDARAITDALRAAMDVKSPMRREWSEIDDFISSPGSPSAKKCKNCDFNEFRFQYVKKRCEIIKRSAEDMNKKMALLNKKSNKLCTILLTLMTQKQSGSSILSALGDKEAILMNHLTHLMGTNRFSLLNEDSSKNMVFNNSIVAKLLLTMRNMREKN